MNTSSIARAALTSALALVVFSAQSQELTLFQDSEGGGPRGFVQMAPPDMAPAAEGSNLVLKGIYRFGDTYHVSLANAEGAVYKATWKAGEGNSVSVANGYQIDVVDSRSVTMSLPNGVSCETDAGSGSNCVGRNQVALSFSETEPVSSRRGRGFPDFGNNDDNIPSFIRERIEEQFGGNVDDMRAMFEAARNGDDRARAQLEATMGGRGGGGRGGRGGGGGNNGGFGGGGNNGGGFGGRGGN